MFKRNAEIKCYQAVFAFLFLNLLFCNVVRMSFGVRGVRAALSIALTLNRLPRTPLGLVFYAGNTFSWLVAHSFFGCTKIPRFYIKGFYASISESNTIVNGPSFIRLICISAPKIPVCTLGISFLHCSIIYSYN